MANVLSKIGWKVVTLAFAVPIGRAVSKATQEVWLAARPGNPPRDPKKSDTTWTDAIGWAVVSGIGIAAGRLFAARSAAKVWRTVFGVEPPGGTPGASIPSDAKAAKAP